MPVLASAAAECERTQPRPMDDERLPLIGRFFHVRAAFHVDCVSAAAQSRDVLFFILTSRQPCCASVYDRHALLRFSPIRMHFRRSSLMRTMGHLRRNRYPSSIQYQPRPRCYLHPRCRLCRTAHARRQFSVFRALRLPPAGQCSRWQSRCVISSLDLNTYSD